jgi:hypothetical protein
LSESRVLTELTVSEIVGRTFTLYRRNLAKYLTVFIPAGIIIGLATTLLRIAIVVPTVQPASSPSQAMASSLAFLGASLSLTLLTGLVVWMVDSVAFGVCVDFASGTLENGAADLGTSVRLVISKLSSILAAQFIVGVLVFLGLIAFLVPAIVFSIVFLMVVPAIVIERLGPLQGLSRSRALVSHRWGKTFVVALVLGLIVGVVSLVFSVIGLPFGAASSLVSGIGEAFILPIAPIGLTFYYYSIKASTTP